MSKSKIATVQSLISGSINKQLILFALPFLASRLIQQMYNMVDLMFVGRILGKEASAAVGASGLLVTCMIGFFTGMRTGEIIALKLSDIDLKNEIISINSTRSRFGEGLPKTAKSIRKVPILKDLKAFLLYFISKKDEGYLLQTYNKKPYRDSQIFVDTWAALLDELGIKYRRPYTMRHTYATYMLKNNLVSPVMLASLLGHSTPKMIYNVYVNYVNQNLQDFNRDIKLY